MILRAHITTHERQTRTATEVAYPHEEAVEAQRGHHKQPEPNEYEYLFVEQIDWQRALDCIALIVFAQCAYGEVAHGDTRKTRRFPEVTALPQVSDHLEPINVEVGTHERVQQKELAAHVDQIQELGDYVQCAYVRAVLFGQWQKATVHETSQASKASDIAKVPVVVDRSVDYTGHGSQALLS